MNRFELKAPEVVGGLLAALGLAVAVRWMFDVAWIAEVIPGAASVGLVNPLLFIAIGCALIAAARPASRSRRAVVRACAFPLIALPIGYLLENFSGVPLGIDIVRAGVRATATNPFPGRISPNASLGFLAVGVALALRSHAQATPRRGAELGCIALVGFIGVAGLVGYFLDLQYLYRLANHNRMLPITAFGLALAAAGLWMLLQQEALAGHDTGRASARTIQWRSMAVILLVALGAGVAGFGAMRQTFEQAASQNLLLTARTHAKALANAIDLGLRFTKTTAARPAIVQALDTLATTPDDAAARAWLRSTAPTLLPLGVGALQFFDARGTLVAEAGDSATPAAERRIPLDNTGTRAALVSRAGYRLASDTDVVRDGRVVGRVVAETPLRFVDSLLADVRESGPATDAIVFGRHGNRALLLPSRADAVASDVLLLDARALPAQPKFAALAGRSGAEMARDARGVAVMSAFAPIGAYGLGFAVETDVSSLYAPLRDRIGALGLALLTIIGVGAYAQRQQVRPILRQLVASQQSLKAILEAQTELVSLATADGRLSYVNPAYAREFARTPAEMVGTNLFDHIESVDRAIVRQRFADVIASGTPHFSENRMIASDGREQWVSWVNTLQHDAEGRPTIHSVGRDITARKQAELALQSAQAFLARTGRIAGVGGWQLDLASGELNWSDETRRIHELPAGHVPALATAIQFYPAEARPVIEAAVQRAARDGTPWDLELPLVTAAGRSIWVRAQGEAEFEAGVPRRLVGAFQDITERRTLQQRLEDSERFVRDITDSLPLRIAYVDREQRFRFVNRAHCERFGLGRDEVLGHTVDELTGHAPDAQVAAHFDAALAGQPQCFEADEVAGGRSLRFENRLIPDRAPDGTVRGLFKAGIDVTERSHADRALRELAVIFDRTPDFVVQTDHRGAITYLNPAARRALGLAADEPVDGRNFAEFNTPETNRRFAAEIVPAVRARGVWLGETTVRAGGSEALPVDHMVIAHRDEHGRVSRYSSILRDISREAEAKAQQLRQTATLHSISEAIPAIVAVVGNDGRYRFVNGAFERWYGSPRELIVGRSVMEVLGLKEYERSRAYIERVLGGETVGFEKTYADGAAERHLGITYIPLELDGGSVDGFVAVAQDITQHKREERRLVELSQRDSMTGLLNRAGFEHFLDAHERKPRRSGDGQLALLYIDLDHFKPVNDTHGHAIGDQLLQAFAQRLQRVVRPTDAVARLGGDEFAIALLGVREPANAHGVAEKVVSAAAEPFVVSGITLNIGASIGVACGLEPGEGWRQLVERADDRLYEAKAAGRGRFSDRREDFRGTVM